MQFKTLRRGPSLAEGVVSDLTRAIHSGALRPGDRLPSEQVLASEFGVARTVVREAISQLKYDGVILSRKGIGAFVTEPSQHTAFRISPECFEKRKELLKLMRLRTGVAAEAAAEAAANRSEQDVLEMRSAVAEMNSALGDSLRGPERQFEAERRLIRAVGDASCNNYASNFIQMIDAQIAENLHSVAVKNTMAARLSQEIVSSFAAIVDAIHLGEVDNARERTRLHFDAAARRLADRADLADI
jgi:GntR family transcriptional repressor for pyruvate dehydrogenase complex